MNRHLRRLSVFTATLFISLSCSLQMSINPLVIKAASAQAQTKEQRAEEALRLYQVGLQQYQQGQFREALETSQHILVIFREIGDRQGEAVILTQIAFIYGIQGQYSQALDYSQQALGIAQQIKDEFVQSFAITAIAGTYTKLGRYTEALDYFQQALPITKSIGNQEGELTILNGIGVIYNNQGEYVKALNYYEQILAIVQQIDNPHTGIKSLENSALNNLAELYLNQGQFFQSLTYYQQALAIAQQIGYAASADISLRGIGNAYNLLGQYPLALNYYQQALAITKQIGDKVGEGTTFHNIGIVYNKLGQYSEALKHYQQALDIAKQIGHKSGEGKRHNSIGSIYDDLGQYPKSLEHYQQALGIARQINDKAGEGTTLNNIGAVYQNLGQYAKALDYFQQALAIIKQIGDKAGEGTTLNNIGFTLFKSGKLAEAEETLLDAIDVRESLRAKELTDSDKVSFYDTQSSVYHLLQQTLIARNKTEAALEIAERSRGRALVELLDSKLSSNPNNQPNIKPPTLQEIKQIASEQNATLVQYSVGYDLFKVKEKEEWQQSKLYIWVIKPTGKITFKQVDLKKSLNTSLQDLVTTSRDDIGVRSRSIFEVIPTNPQPQNSTEKLQQLHKILIAPIADLLPKDPNERVIFIPQESLFLVPFPALQDEQGKYLIEKHTILTAPAIQVLDLTRKQKHNGQRSANDVLVVGNPTMPKIRFGELVENLDPLPGAEREANQIAKLFNTEALIGNQATKATVMQKMQQARIIHLATHGLLHDFKGFGVPGAIALAPNPPASPLSKGVNDGIDGLLTAGEIFDMKLSADLVVLSACDTGRGDITGDGVVGLSRSLISAGVPSVLVSLWAVNDNSTAFLMTEFYHNLQQNPDKALALRQAMLTTMKQYPNPKQWAAFTLIGEAD
ncbi:MAG: tetratricopeptide repeat protein [Cyanobacteriota bacterium]